MSEKDDSDDPTRSPKDFPIQRIAPFKPDRLMNVVLENNEQRNMTNVFKALREESISRQELQVEITESIQI